jgi:hypothetical protein
MARRLLENGGQPGREITATATCLLDRLPHRTIPMDGTAPNIQMPTETETETDLPEVEFEEVTATQRLLIPTYRATTGSGMEEEVDGNPHEMIDAVTTGTTPDGMTGDGEANMTTGCGPAGQGVAVGRPFVTETLTVTVIIGGVRSPIVSRSAVTSG